jgi:hypothetical protein
VKEDRNFKEIYKLVSLSNFQGAVKYILSLVKQNPQYDKDLMMITTNMLLDIMNFVLFYQAMQCMPDLSELSPLFLLWEQLITTPHIVH